MSFIIQLKKPVKGLGSIRLNELARGSVGHKKQTKMNTCSLGTGLTTKLMNGLVLHTGNQKSTTFKTAK